MNAVIAKIIDWSEVWAPLLPLTIYFVNPAKKLEWSKPIIIYLVVTVINNSIIDFIYHPYIENKILSSNHIFYNLNSALRFFLFSSFFQNTFPVFKKINPWLQAGMAAAIYITFIFLNNAYNFSSKLMAVESAALLACCILWFILKIRDADAGSFFSNKSSWIVSGIFFYSGINFVVFLFYETLISTENDFAYYIWDVHNVSFIIMCLLFYMAFRKK